MDWYYSNEKPLPLDSGFLYAITRARDKKERANTDSVLAWFFVKQDDGWHQKRCDEELEKYWEKSAKASKSASARWGNSQSERNANASETHKERTPERNASQEPVTNNQKPKNNTAPEDPPQEPERLTRAGHLAVSLREKGIAVNSTHPTLLQWIEDKFTLPAILEAVALAKMAKPGESIPPNYIDKILRAPPKKAVDQWWLDDNKMMAMAQKLGVSTYGKQRDVLKLDIQIAMKSAATQAAGA